jgi:hypothetical protein
VIRSGVNNKAFQANVSAAQITLLSYTSLGVQSTVATITFTTYLASSTAVAVHLNSTDTCLYVLLYVSGSYQVIKINDTTGVVTAIGSSFTPTTAANWPTGFGTGTTLEIDSGTGHLKVTNNGFTHLINKTTGAIVSQNTVVSLGSFLAASIFYVTQDGSVGISSSPSITIQGGLPTVIHNSYGQLSEKIVPSGFDTLVNSSGRIQNSLSLIDSDKVCFSTLFTSSATLIAPAVIYPRTEFDKYIKSVADYAAGVI